MSVLAKTIADCPTGKESDVQIYLLKEGKPEFTGATLKAFFFSNVPAERFVVLDANPHGFFVLFEEV